MNTKAPSSKLKEPRAKTKNCYVLEHLNTQIHEHERFKLQAQNSKCQDKGDNGLYWEVDN